MVRCVSPLLGAGSKVKLLSSRSSIIQGIGEMFVDFKDAGFVPASVAIVGCREDGDHILIVMPTVPVDHQLMRSAYQGEFVGLVELEGDVLAEDVPGSSRRYAPALAFVRVGPKQIAHRSKKHMKDSWLPFVRYLLFAVELAHLVKRFQTGTQSSMKTVHSVFNQSSNRQIVKQVREVAPHIWIPVLPHALVIKPITIHSSWALTLASPGAIRGFRG